MPALASSIVYDETDKSETVEVYDIRNLCGNIARQIDALGVEKARLIYHDWE